MYPTDPSLQFEWWILCERQRQGRSSTGFCHRPMNIHLIAHSFSFLSRWNRVILNNISVYNWDQKKINSKLIQSEWCWCWCWISAPKLIFAVGPGILKDTLPKIIVILSEHSNSMKHTYNKMNCCHRNNYIWSTSMFISYRHPCFCI